MGGYFFNIMCFVDNEIIILSQDGIFCNNIGKKERVIDHNNVRFLRGTSDVVGKTTAIGAATLGSTIARIRADFCPETGVATVVKAVVFGDISRFGLFCPNDQGQRAFTLVF